MDLKDCFNLGYIAKLHGYKGEVSLFLDVTDPLDYKGLKLIYCEINKYLVPFSIISIRIVRNRFAILKLEGVESEKQSKELLKKRVYLPLTFLPELDDQTFYDHEIMGFAVEDISYGNIGLVVDVLDLSSNPLLKIDNKGKEILVPLMKDLVTKVDRKNKVLYISSPEGLISLYL